MQSEELYEKLKTFIENDPACQKTLTCLNEKAQVGIVVGGSLRCCVQVPGGKVNVEKAACLNPDFIFNATPRAIETLISEEGLTPADLGAKLVKQLLTQQVTLAMPGHFFQVIRKGYFDILKVGGKDFMTVLKRHNITSPKKIMDILKKLRKKTA